MFTHYGGNNILFYVRCFLNDTQTIKDFITYLNRYNAKTQMYLELEKKNENVKHK